MAAQNIAGWLRTLPGISNVKPVTVVIGKQTFHGAAYTQTLPYTEGMRIVQEGKVKAGDTYDTDSILLLGDLPKTRKKGTCFPFDGQEWYVASYYQHDNRNEYHPFGKCFMLKPWTIAGEKIDKHERRPYDRVPMTVS